MATNVLLTNTDRWATPARLAIGFAKAGCNVYAVCPRYGHPLLKTRAVQQSFWYNGLRPLESLLAAVETVNPQIIIPCDDRGVEHLHELHAMSGSLGSSGNSIRSLIEFSLGSPDSYPIVSSRNDLLSVAVEEGIRVPATSLMNTPSDLASWGSGQKFPWVLKADGSFGGRGVRLVERPEQVKKFYAEIGQPFVTRRVIKRLIVNRDSFWLRPWWNHTKPSVIAQAFVKGRPANCAVACWKGRVLAGIGVEVLNSQGVAGPANVVRLVDNPEMMRAAEKIARRLKLSGFFGLDFIIEEGTKDTYLIEMNPRCTILCQLELGKGRNMVAALCAELSGEPDRDTPPVTQNDLIAYFPQAWTFKNEFLESSFQDIPQGEDELVQELLHPWPERTLLYRVACWLGPKRA
jgi:hypothetical protein